MEQKEITASLLGNRYQLQRALGTGGMSTVYLARDLMLERPVAVKVLKQDFSQNAAFRNRFRQEAQAAANLSHPNIVTVHDFGFHRGRVYIVMEYVPGQNLKYLIKQVGKFSIEEAISLITQACAGIGYAHRAGLVHCDVKPHNFIVTPDNRVKVTDFGIARALSSIHPDEKTDVVWGSPQYFSPEQAAGLAPSPASDVYSLGTILYEMLTGKLPFNSDDPTELARLHRSADPIPPSKLNPEISPALEQIILKVLSKEASSRYRTADQMGRILSTFLQQMRVPVISPSTPVVSTPIQTMPVPPARNASTLPVIPFAPEAETVYKLAYEEPAPRESSLNIDWVTIGLGLFAALCVGGLVPFWLYIWLLITSNRPIP